MVGDGVVGVEDEDGFVEIGGVLFVEEGEVVVVG